MENKEIKTISLDLAKCVSYLNELQKTNNQNYITPEGLAFMEGVTLTSSGKVKVCPPEKCEELLEMTRQLVSDNTKLLAEVDNLKRKLRTKKKTWF